MQLSDYDMYGIINTIGHSNKPFVEFVHMLDKHGIDLLIDVRSHPGSKSNPQYNIENFVRQLNSRYLWLPDLGGPNDGEYADPKMFPKHHIGKVRSEFKNVPEAERPKVWWNTGLYDYALWMGTSITFINGLSTLLDLSTKHNVAIMCAEALWWKCHRSMISDVVEALGGCVYHIMSASAAKRHVQGKALEDRLSRYESATSWIWHDTSVLNASNQ